MYVLIYEYIYMYIYIHILYVYICIHVYTYIYVYIYICIYTCRERDLSPYAMWRGREMKGFAKLWSFEYGCHYLNRGGIY